MGKVIHEDTRQQRSKHSHKHEWWKAHGVEFAEREVALKCGDYAVDGSNVIVDTKRNVAELAQNLTREHSRVRRAYAEADSRKWQLVILVENEQGITSLESLKSWVNDRCCKCGYFINNVCDPYNAKQCHMTGRRKPVQGPQLAKIAETMQLRYGVSYRFCEPQESARIICDLLGVEYAQD